MNFDIDSEAEVAPNRIRRHYLWKGTVMPGKQAFKVWTIGLEGLMKMCRMLEKQDC